MGRARAYVHERVRCEQDASYGRRRVIAYRLIIKKGRNPDGLPIAFAWRTVAQKMARKLLKRLWCRYLTMNRLAARACKGVCWRRTFLFSKAQLRAREGTAQKADAPHLPVTPKILRDLSFLTGDP